MTIPVSQDIIARIPHREPFLWVDEIISYQDNTLVARKHVPENLDVFKGHYPDNPILPGVLICEAIFQAGALLISKMLEDGQNIPAGNVPVVTRIESAKFKRMVRPGDDLEITVKLKEQITSVYFLQGSVRISGKVATQAEFACAMTSPQ